MALVRISKQLISDVEQKCNIMRIAEMREVADPDTSFDGSQDPAAAYLATELAWGEHLHLKHQMPAEWLKETGVVCFTTTYQHEDGHNETTAQVSYSDVKIPVPPGTQLNYSYLSNGKHDRLILQVPFDLVTMAASDPEHRFHTVASAVLAIVKKETRARKITKAWNERQTQITQFLHKCKSLNEAIKLWPQVKLYVPQSYIETVETPVVRPQNAVRKEKVMENVDTDNLTAAAIAAKLAGVI